MGELYLGELNSRNFTGGSFLKFTRLCDMFALDSKKHVVSHVSPGAEEGCCVTRFVCSRRSMWCHMFRLVLKKAVLSHVSPGAEESSRVTCSVTCFAWG